jgi:hypothetical protein
MRKPASEDDFEAESRPRLWQAWQGAERIDVGIRLYDSIGSLTYYIMPRWGGLESLAGCKNEGRREFTQAAPLFLAQSANGGSGPE